jgi:TonB-linked SusC/RagA family outer membrane protein
MMKNLLKRQRDTCNKTWCLSLVIMCLLMCSTVTQAMNEQQKVTISGKDISLQRVFQSIKKKTGLTVFYSNELLNDSERISLDFQNEDLEKVLDFILREKNIGYEIRRNKVIVLSRKVEKQDNVKITPVSSIQEIRIAGTVVDNRNEGLPGVSILLKGSQRGTTTNESGDFFLDIPDVNAVLVFSFVGYLTQEITVGSRDKVNVTLLDDDKALEEVVVVGYGTQARATLTGSIATTKGEDLKQNPSVNLSNSLAGRLPGVIASNRSGAPGSGSSILIRGQSTLGNNSPLIVIDGVWGRGGFEQINPNDVESISVLKDASAAIYGAQAANGVILITTKRGKSGKPVINYTMNQGISQPTRLAKMANSSTYASYMNELLNYQGQPDRFSAEDIEKFSNGSDPVNFPNTNWQKAALKKYSKQSQHNISVRGGSDEVKYYVSGSFANQNGILKNSNIDYKNFVIRSNIDANLPKIFG